MTIRVTCSSCFRTYGVKDQYAGRRIKCPDCGSPVQIPDGAADALPAADEFGGDDFGGDDFGMPAAAPSSRSTRPSRPAATKSGSSFPVVGIIIGIVIGGFALVLCAGIVTFALLSGDDDGPVIADWDDEVDQVVDDRQVGATREESGRLSFTDDTLEGGEYFDEYHLSADQGEVFVIDLYSEDFDPYLIVRDSDRFNEFQLDNDDYEGDTTRSQIMFTAPRKSSYLVVATTFDVGETGSYRMTIREVSTDAGSATPAREESGSLMAGDTQLDNGEYYDSHLLTAQEGDLFVIDLHSSDFDTYLIVEGPDGSDFVVFNDDFGESTQHSQITMLAPVTGEYEVQVTTYEPGESGSYRLTIQEM